MDFSTENSKRKDNTMDIRSYTLSELEEALIELKEAKFRGKQIYQWLHQKHVNSYDEMTNLSKGLREKLEQHIEFVPLQMLEVQQSKLDGTRKYLFGLKDHHVVESVWMEYKHGNSVCISSQVGCKMGCRFCASTLDGFVRNLSAGEMLSQIYQIEADTKRRVSNIVVMGTGEPLDNYEELVRFIRMISDENGSNISQRNITVSTCGLVPKIKELAEEQLQITLALSLHAPTQEKRVRLMPIANAYPLDEVLEACKEYFEKTHRRISFEYSLVQGENDSIEDAMQLISLIKGMNCHVNLIPVNPIKERDYKQPDTKSIEAYKNKLEDYGINVTIRREMGRDIDGACGQLRKKYMER